jgi:hypothetical protein
VMRNDDAVRALHHRFIESQPVAVP